MSIGFAILGALRRTIDSGLLRLYRYRRVPLYFFAVGASGSLFREYLFTIDGATGPSMYATIPDAANFLCVNRMYGKGHGIKVGDVVQIASPIFPKQYNGKRVIALPGDYVLRSKSYSVAPGGAPVPGITDWKQRIEEEKVAAGQAVASSAGPVELMKSLAEDSHEEEEWDEPEMIQIPEGHVWVEGDNLAWSRDSRFFGPLPMALIKGRSSWFADGLFSFSSLKPGRGLRKIEKEELDAVLGVDIVSEAE
ncbi:Mitochondrial inner membrane peptidase complex subunit [Lithohypha guttulata]|uniref:Mitochondrial inner membrane protease subunit n=1 Tax=Lithohypha guttulata TaxID=1690604 RepID=A0AAN7Y527_9EURO|nr:Mitochondrial inner membrane peptidase complex subunit [Lithohypha guttulata]KAK5103025.1 Mitochondrial inner membrane peptidase complex subunit [Lithohypha guttulata]